MAELFQTTVPNVSMHLRNVYAEGELQAAVTVKEFLIVRQEENRQVSRAVENITTSLSNTSSLLKVKPCAAPPCTCATGSPNSMAS